jgi:hypothetical protein
MTLKKSQTIKSPVPESVEANRDRTYLTTNSSNITPHTEQSPRYRLLRLANIHWNYCQTERREEYLQCIQIHRTREDIDILASKKFEEFDHCFQMLIFSAIAFCCPDLFRVLVAQGYI